MNDPNNSICPKCASIIPADAPGGLCPRCALEGAATVSTPTTGGRRTPPPRIEEIAPHFPELEILELIGAGGMGAVYKARQPQLDRLVALKILSHDLASDPAFVERFDREAKVLARLSHPNIVGIHDFGTAGPYCYLLMELVDGVNLRQAMRAGRFTPNEALAMVQHLCSALKFAHEEGVLHRDIKPENILIDSKGRVKIADFGIAKLVGEGRQPDVTLTMQGSILGSPHYMAPEQIETPGDVDQRADIYSLGVVLYELLTGGLPIGRFALPSEKAVMDARIDHIVLRTLEKEREARYQTAGEVGTEMEAVTKHPALPSAKATPSQGEPGAARFSLASALLTGGGLVLAFSFLWLWIMMFLAPVKSSAEMEGEISKKLIVVILPAILHFLAAAGTSLTGFILGGRALGEIRRSGGVKTGLGSAIFATTAWPILLLFSVGTVFLKMPMPGDGLTLGPMMVVLLVVLPVLVASWLLVRSLWRWAGGVERKDGTRFHPGLGIPLLMVMLITIGGPVLLTGIAGLILPAGERRDPYAESQKFMEEEEARINDRLAALSSSPSKVPWRLGQPEVMIPLIVQPGQQFSMRLLLQDPEGNSWSFDLGELIDDPDFPRKPELLQVGTYLKSDSSKGALLALAASRSGKNSHLIRSIEDLRGWEFNEALPNELTFDTPGRREITLATVSKDGEQVRDGILSLEVIVTDSIATEVLPDSQ